MSAILRQAARRIGGSMLQRTQAAVAEEGRRLLPRRMYSTGERAAEDITHDIKRKQQELADAEADGRRNLKASTNWHDPHARPSALEVQQKKDELYEVLSKMENWRNRRLLMNLSVHVYHPRTPTTQWHRLRASKWATNVVRAVATVSFAIGASIGSDLLERKVKSSAAETREFAEFAKALVKRL